MIIALTGNPNAGKTTLFNALTGASAHVGNFPGVTVEYKKGRVTWNPSLTILDLPGVYSLTPYSEEEEVTKQALEQVDGIINVADASNLSHHLYLTLQLTELGIPTVLAINMMDEATHLQIDCPKLEQYLGIPVVGISARKKTGLRELTNGLSHQIKQKNCPCCPVPPVAGEEYVVSADRRYRYLEQVCSECIRQTDKPQEKTKRADRILLHSKAAFPCCLGVLFLLFFVPFGPLGRWLQRGMELLIEKVSHLPLSVFPSWFQSFLREGIFGGVGSVLSFFPCIFLLFLCLSLLEDSGYLARISFLADRPLQTIGLSGRAAVPFLTGFGCTVPAVAAAKTMPSQRDKLLTVLCLPFLSCSAKLPVYTFLTNTFFPKTGFLLIFLLYLSGILWGILNTAFSHKFLVRGVSESFVMELPRYRVPHGKQCLKETMQRSGEFLKKTFTVIFLFSVLVWALQFFTPKGTVASDFSKSILFFWGTKVAPFFAPLGFGTPEAASALLAGLGAKEAVVSTLSILKQDLVFLFSPLSAFSFLHFVLLYMPCVAAFAAMRKELGTLSATLAILYQTAFAWLLSFGIYQVGLQLL
ncbi:MAG: ferrous iron transporter B [Ruminococcaceae bacterium]|nr:ferrous iron transporter B [Oscillospiraceae bacterium]